MNVNDKPNNSREQKEPRGRAESKEKFWRGLADFDDAPEARRFRENEFPYAAADIEAANAKQRIPGLSRRQVLKYMAASAALAGLTACTKLPTEKIVPYVRPPEEIVPGKPLFYATSMTFGGEGIGLLAESYMGRPTKIEGNPEHPGSVGHTDIWGQAATLDLYDPYRSQTVVHNGEIRAWDDFYAELRRMRGDWSVNQGAGVRILTENIISPTLGAQMRAFLAAFSQAKWHQWEPWSRDNTREGAKLAFGEYVHPVYHFENADVIVSLDADFLSMGPGHVRYTRDYA
ncbi:MAG TPA: TAT-variant-translocated molybdopterin oxidoreductase, partial [Candidatus Acidoferrales bacterium]|nr:TAT-variant-translocated molybdopterin oxidoreductase [Candidatus Acidoferrales bacterium]